MTWNLEDGIDHELNRAIEAGQDPQTLFKARNDARAERDRVALISWDLGDRVLADVPASGWARELWGSAAENEHGQDQAGPEDLAAAQTEAEALERIRKAPAAREVEDWEGKGLELFGPDRPERVDMSAVAWADALQVAVSALCATPKQGPTRQVAGSQWLCAHADRNGRGAHWLEPGGTCSRTELERGEYRGRVLFLPSSAD